MRSFSFRRPDELSKRAVEVLRYLKDHGEDIVVGGLDVWSGMERTNWKVVEQLLEACLISQDQYSPTHYNLNGSGERFLAGLPPYVGANGKFYEDANQLLAKGDLK